MSRPALALACLLAASCDREDRLLDDPLAKHPRSAGPYEAPALGVDLASHRGERPPAGFTNPEEARAWSVAEGQRLYNWYNCVGCHAHGGGGIGPPLMDGAWVYGGAPRDIYISVVEGRPNGMPSFRGRIPEEQVWRIVAYVRSLSGQLRFDVLPGRSDSIAASTPVPSMAPREPRQPPPPAPRVAP